MYILCKWKCYLIKSETWKDNWALDKGVIGGLVYSRIWSFSDLVDPYFGTLPYCQAQRNAIRIENCISWGLDFAGSGYAVLGG